jgi:nucleotide-binding universal stress UspA family protein
MSGVFARVLCADDGTPAAEQVARLARRVAGAGARIDRIATLSAGNGGPAGALLREIRSRGCTLAVVGHPGHSRAVGIASGAVATFVLHEAPCSVLVARSAPRRRGSGIVVGVDGSPESKLALAAARDLAERLELPLRAVTGTSHAHVDIDAARAIAPTLEELHEDAVDLLAHLSEDADLLVVGSRGLKGVRSLGSVSERVAHEARCPVLVVRATPAPGPARRSQAGPGAQAPSLSA